MGLWEDVGRPLLTPQADQYYRAASSVDTARKEYDAAFAALRNYEDRQEATDRDETWDELARIGKLTGTTAAKALGQIRAAKQNRLAAAQMQAQMYRAAARQRQQELGAMAKSATTGDMLNLTTKAAEVGLGMWGAGMFTKPITDAGAAPGAAQAATKATEMIQPGATAAMPGVTAAARNAQRYNPLAAGIADAGLGTGNAFTAAATRGRYPELTQDPWAEYMKRQSSASSIGGSPPETTDPLMLEWLRRMGYNR